MERESFAHPVKLVKIRQEDIKPNRGNPREPKLFGEVTSKVRENISTQIASVSKVFEQHFKDYPKTPAVAKVNLKQEAIAKSHRPISLFSKTTCPIIGVKNSNELLVEVTPQSLDKLNKKVLTSHAKIVEANISTLSSISPYSAEDVLTKVEKEHIKNEDKDYVKIKLFKFFNEKTNIDAEREFEQHLSRNNAQIVKKINYSKHLVIYKVKIEDKLKLDAILNFGAVKSLSYFPVLSSNQQHSTIEKDLGETEIFFPEQGTEYPYVGVIDSGTRDENPYLSPWVEHREDYVLPEEKNCEHGSFVTGIIAYGDRLTNQQSNYDGVKIIDITAIPNNNPQYGQVGRLTEDELVEILQEIVPKYSGKVKVWNLSLGLSKICDDQAFSDLAISLDEIQDENDVTFVISTGNYEEDYRAWPVASPENYNDRITSPADSVRAITVGSISHLDSDLAKLYEPSPFSRKGPGPNYIVKPELVDFGGNINLNPQHISCVPSIGEYGGIRGDVGTSFATPRISAILAKIHHYLDYNISRNLANALLIHSAIDRRDNKRPKKEERAYLGFGQPQGIKQILDCTEHSSTIVFEGTIYPSTYIEINDFPFPQVLKENGKWFGDIIVTIVYNPPLNSDYSFEYCRSNIEVSLGTIKPKGYSSEVPLERMGALEKELVENGMKWAPIKVYHRKITGGLNDHPWKLKLTLSGRSEEILAPQDFALIVTIKDPQQNKDVYNDVTQQLRQRFIYSDIQISNRIRPTIL
ncbi:hypothetical protein CN270_11430 [Priestia megaterium]|uniref:S8 family peptidase n=1 Tax=Priestia megaterium TaxID=1404 RepID=UPI000BF86452|nr:S8 family peptidase [Priestia megaterium]PFE33925.1 hypothetical protein CN270_11430 [Priestia megaterium]